MPSSIPGSDISRGERRRSSPTPPTVDARAGFPDQEARAKPARESGPAHLAQTLRAVGRFARRKPLGALGALIVVAMLVMAAFAERIAPYGYDDTIPGPPPPARRDTRRGRSGARGGGGPGPPPGGGRARGGAAARGPPPAISCPTSRRRSSSWPRSGSAP